MKMKKLCIALFLFITTINLLSAQTMINAELKGLLQKSVTYFPKVKEVEQSVQLAEQKLKLTELNKYPDVTMDASYAYVRPKIEVPFGANTFQFAPVHNFSAAVNGTYALIDFGRLKANIEKSKLELQSAHHVAAQLETSLFSQISQLYFQIVFTQKAIQIQDQILSLLFENKKVIDAQLKNGTAIQLDVLTIQSKIDNEINRKIDIETNLKKLLNLLHYATGVDNVTAGELIMNVKNYTYDEALQSAIEHNPALAIAKDKISISKSDLTIAKLYDKPFIGAKASIGSKNGYLPTINDPKFNYNAGIGISIPLFNGGKNKQLVKIQEQGRALSETNAVIVLHETEKDIQAALIDIMSSQSRIKNANTQIEQAALAQKLSTSKLLNGTGTPLEITNANTDYQKALLNQLQFQYQLCNAQIELLKIMGVSIAN
jgi:outer membrane protein TolC